MALAIVALPSTLTSELTTLSLTREQLHDCIPLTLSTDYLKMNTTHERKA